MNSGEFMPGRIRFNGTFIAVALAMCVSPLIAAAADAPSTAKDKDTVSTEHNMIGAAEDKTNAIHTMNPDAQWYPDAGFGLFLHWGIASVSARNISWSMIPGRVFARQQLSDT